MRTRSPAASLSGCRTPEKSLHILPSMEPVLSTSLSFQKSWPDFVTMRSARATAKMPLTAVDRSDKSLIHWPFSMTLPCSSVKVSACAGARPPGAVQAARSRGPSPGDGSGLRPAFPQTEVEISLFHSACQLSRLLRHDSPGRGFRQGIAPSTGNSLSRTAP